MAHSLETRVPFMDNDLVDFAMQCPVNLKLNNLADVVRINENEPGNKSGRYFQKTSDGKQILRDVMSRYIPTEITQAQKQGFSSPDASWFKGESIEFVKRKLLTGNPRIYEYLDADSVRDLIHQHLDGRENRRLLIWSLLNAEEVLACIL
jgi:asparagine synthase (glutamine-hydrolysing)